MKQMTFMLLLVIACRGEQSVASKSATATAAETDHSAHGAATEPHARHGSPSSTSTDHTAHGRGTAHDHAAMGHGTPTAGDAHAQHRAASGSSGGHAGHATASRAGTHDQHAGMQHGATTAGADPHAQHRHTPSAAPPNQSHDHSQHGTTASTPAPVADPHAQHRAAATPATPIASAAPRTNSDIRAIQPASTLQPDAFDAPAPVSVSEAAKARQSGGHEGHQTHGITPGEDRENPPSPMPAMRDGTSAPAPDSATVYTCPMHPEVTSDKPGTCPKCGMTLVKKDSK